MGNPRLWLARFVCGLALVCALAAPASAQIVYGQPLRGDLNLVGTHWKLSGSSDDVTVDQFAAAATALVPLRDNLEARVYVAAAKTRVSQLGEDYDLNGVTDMRVQVTHSFAADRLFVGLGVNLPIGQRNLSLDREWVVMNYLAQSFLSFPVRRLGAGFGLNATVGGAQAFGDTRVGVSASFDLAGAYDAYRDQGSYKPGNTFNLTLGDSTSGPPGY